MHPPVDEEGVAAQLAAAQALVARAARLGSGRDRRGQLDVVFLEDQGVLAVPALATRLAGSMMSGP